MGDFFDPPSEFEKALGIKPQTKKTGSTRPTNKSAYSQSELEDILRQAGWDEDKIPMMSAIGMAESSGKASAYNPGIGPGGRKTKEQSIGLWQINMLPSLGRNYDRRRLAEDPVYNAKVAKDIFNQQGLKAWGAYTDGRYKKYFKGKALPYTGQTFGEKGAPPALTQFEQALYGEGGIQGEVNPATAQSLPGMQDEASQRVKSYLDDFNRPKINSPEVQQSVAQIEQALPEKVKELLPTYMSWLAETGLLDSPENRAEFELVSKIIQGQKNVYETPPAAQRTVPSLTGKEGSSYKTRTVGKATDDLDGIYKTVRVNPKWSDERKMREVFKGELTPDEINNLIVRLRAAGKPLINTGPNHDNTRIAITRQNIADAKSEATNDPIQDSVNQVRAEARTIGDQRLEQSQNYRSPEISKSSPTSLPDSEAEKALERRMQDPGYSLQDRLRRSLLEPWMLMSPAAGKWFGRDVDVTEEKKRLKDLHGSYSKAWDAEQEYQNEPAILTAGRMVGETARTFSKSLLSGTTKTLAFLDNFQEENNPILQSIPEEYRPTLRNSVNIADFLTRLTFSKDAKTAYDEWNKNRNTDKTTLDSTILFKSANEFEKAVGEDPVLKGRFLGELSSGVGSMLSFVALGAVMPSLRLGPGVARQALRAGLGRTVAKAALADWSTAASGILQTAGPGYEEGKQANLSEEDAKRYGIIQGLLGMTEMLGAGNEFVKLVKNKSVRVQLATGILQAIKREGLEEFSQEVGQTTGGKAALEYLKDTDKSTYNKVVNLLNRLPKQLAETMANEGVIAAITGGLMGGATHALTKAGTLSKDESPKAEIPQSSPPVDSRQDVQVAKPPTLQPPAEPPKPQVGVRVTTPNGNGTITAEPDGKRWRVELDDGRVKVFNKSRVNIEPGQENASYDDSSEASYDPKLAKSLGFELVSGKSNKVPQVEIKNLSGLKAYRERDQVIKAAIDTLKPNPAFREFIQDTKVADFRGEPIYVFHGGIKFKGDSFDSAQSHDFGFHVGDAEQANARVMATSPKGERVATESAELIPLVVSIKNPLKMDDMGEWHPTTITSQLVRKGVITPEEASDIRNAHMLGLARKEAEEKLKILLESKGYDGIEYVNEYEGEVHKPSWIAFRPNQLKSIFNQGTFSKDSSIFKAAVPDNRTDFERMMELYPDAQVELVDDGPTQNASIESAASQEAISRQQSEKLQGLQRVVVDTRSGNERPLIGPDAVDYNPQPFEQVEFRGGDRDGEVISRGDKARSYQRKDSEHKKYKSDSIGYNNSMGSHILKAASGRIPLRSALNKLKGNSNFQRWFGNSKATYENSGIPIPFVHGTQATEDYEAFDLDKSENNRDNLWNGVSLVRAESSEISNDYADPDKSYSHSEDPRPRLIPVVIRTEKPLFMEYDDFTMANFESYIDELGIPIETYLPNLVRKHKLEDLPQEDIDYYGGKDYLIDSYLKTLDVRDYVYENYDSIVALPKWSENSDENLIENATEILVFKPSNLKGVFNSGTWNDSPILLKAAVDKAKRLGLEDNGPALQWINRNENKVKNWNKYLKIPKEQGPFFVTEGGALKGGAAELARDLEKEFKEKSSEIIDKYGNVSLRKYLEDMVEAGVHDVDNEQLQQAIWQFKSDPDRATRELEKFINDQRVETLKEWKKYIDQDNHVYKKDPFFKNFIWDSITKIRNNRPDVPPARDAAVIAAVYEAIKADPNNSTFEVLYKEKATEVLLNQGEEFTHQVEDGTWVKIPQTQVDSPDFEKNAAAVRSISCSTWCTSQGTERIYITYGDFWVLVKNQKTRLALRFEGDAVAEIQGEDNNGIIPEEYLPDVVDLVLGGKVDLTIGTMRQILDAVRRSKLNKKRKQLSEKIEEVKKFALEGYSPFETRVVEELIRSTTNSITEDPQSWNVDSVLHLIDQAKNAEKYEDDLKSSIRRAFRENKDEFREETADNYYPVFAQSYDINAPLSEDQRQEAEAFYQKILSARAEILPRIGQAHLELFYPEEAKKKLEDAKKIKYAKEITQSPLWKKWGNVWNAYETQPEIFGAKLDKTARNEYQLRQKRGAKKFIDKYSANFYGRIINQVQKLRTEAIRYVNTRSKVDKALNLKIDEKTLSEAVETIKRGAEFDLNRKDEFYEGEKKYAKEALEFVNRDSFKDDLSEVVYSTLEMYDVGNFIKTAQKYYTFDKELRDTLKDPRDVYTQLNDAYDEITKWLEGEDYSKPEQRTIFNELEGYLDIFALQLKDGDPFSEFTWRQINKEGWTTEDFIKERDEFSPWDPDTDDDISKSENAGIKYGLSKLIPIALQYKADTEEEFRKEVGEPKKIKNERELFEDLLNDVDARLTKEGLPKALIQEMVDDRGPIAEYIDTYAIDVNDEGEMDYFSPFTEIGEIVLFDDKKLEAEIKSLEEIAKSDFDSDRLSLMAKEASTFEDLAKAYRILLEETSKFARNYRSNLEEIFKEEVGTTDYRKKIEGFNFPTTFKSRTDDYRVSDEVHEVFTQVGFAVNEDSIGLKIVDPQTDEISTLFFDELTQSSLEKDLRNNSKKDWEKMAYNIAVGELDYTASLYPRENRREHDFEGVQKKDPEGIKRLTEWLAGQLANFYLRRYEEFESGRKELEETVESKKIERELKDLTEKAGWQVSTWGDYIDKSYYETDVRELEGFVEEESRLAQRNGDDDLAETLFRHRKQIVEYVIKKRDLTKKLLEAQLKEETGTDDILKAASSTQIEDRLWELKDKPFNKKFVKGITSEFDSDGNLFVSPEAIEVLRRAESLVLSQQQGDFIDSSVFSAGFIRASGLSTYPAVLDKLAAQKPEGFTEKDVAPLKKLSSDIKQAIKNKSVVVYADPAKVAHEQRHRIRYEKSKFSDSIDKYYVNFEKTFDKTGKIAERAFDKYFKRVYFSGKKFSELSKSDRAILQEEIFNHILDGDLTKIGLTADMATEFIENDLNAYIEKNGPEALEDLEKFTDEKSKQLVSAVRVAQIEAKGDGPGDAVGQAKREPQKDSRKTTEREPSPQPPVEEGSGVGRIKERALPKTIAENTQLNVESMEYESRFYPELSRDAVHAEALSWLNEIGLEAAYSEVFDLPPSALSTAKRMAVLETLDAQISHYYRQGNESRARAIYQTMVTLSNNISPEYTEYGQAISQLARWAVLGSEGIVNHVENRREKKGKKRGTLSLEAQEQLREESKEIRDLVEEVNDLRRQLEDNTTSVVEKLFNDVSKLKDDAIKGLKKAFGSSKTKTDEILKATTFHNSPSRIPIEEGFNEKLVGSFNGLRAGWGIYSVEKRETIDSTRQYGTITHKVNITKPESSFLKWDKPYVEQSEEVKAILEKLSQDEKYRKTVEDFKAEKTVGKVFYKSLPGTAKEKSKFLHSKGISGNTYADNKADSKVFVSFSADEAIIEEILKNALERKDVQSLNEVTRTRLINLGKAKYLEARKAGIPQTLDEFKSAVLNELEENLIDSNGANPYLDSLYLRVRTEIKKDLLQKRIEYTMKKYSLTDEGEARRKLAETRDAVAKRLSQEAQNLREAKSPKDSRTALDIAIDNAVDGTDLSRDDVKLAKDRKAFYSEKTKSGLKPEEITDLYFKAVETWIDVNTQLREAREYRRAEKAMAEPGRNPIKILTPEEVEAVNAKIKEKNKELAKKRSEFKKTVDYLTDRPETTKQRIGDWYLRWNRGGEAMLTTSVRTISHNLIAQRGVKLLNTAEVIFEVGLAKAEKLLGRDIFAKGELDTDEKVKIRKIMMEELKSSTFPSVRQAVKDFRRGDVQALEALMSIAAHKQRVVEGVLAYNPELYEDMLGKFTYGEDPARVRPIDDSYSKGAKITEKITRGMEKVVEWSTLFNRLQEKHFRFATFLATVRFELEAAGIDANKVIEEGSVENIDKKILEKAVKRALEDTFGEDIPRDNSLMRSISSANTVARWIPFPINPLLFRRFLFNSTKFMVEHSPFILAKIATEKGFTRRDAAKFMSGTLLFGMAVQLLSMFGSDDDDPLTLTIGGINFKVAAYNPLSTMLILANIVHRARKGKRPLKNMEELWKLFGIDTRYPNLAMDWYDAIYSLTGTEDQAGEKFSEKTKTVAGKGIVAYLKPLSTIRDIQMEFDNEENILRDYRDEPFVGEFKKALPFSERVTQLFGTPTKVEEEAMGRGPKRREYSLLGQLGITVVPPRDIGPKFSAAEEYLDEALIETRKKRLKFYKTPDERRKAAIAGQLYTALDKGENPEKVAERANKYGAEGILSKGQVADITQMAKARNGIERKAVTSQIEDLVNALDYATPQEAQIIKEVLAKKAKSQYKNGSLTTLEIRKLETVFGPLGAN